MTPDSTSVAIVGGGLSGLLAALRLRQQGAADVALFEARAVLGGRILSVDAAGASADAAVPALDRFDLGPSWFWPEFQPPMDRLVDELGLARLEQFDEGDLLIERSAREAPVRVGGQGATPPSMRLVGSTGALVAAIAARLEPTWLHAGCAVRALRCAGEHVELDVEQSDGQRRTWRAEQVLLALPPRLAERSITFEPPLPAELARRWQATETWMAPHAKYVAIFEAPFWREQGLCGAARSRAGPMVEIHDASMPGGHAALFGFLGVPASVRRGVPDEVLRTHCRAQLGRLFGERAERPVADALKDWALDPLTATEADLTASGQHPEAPPPVADHGPWRGRLQGIGSEWSPQFAGYLAGAVEAAERGVRSLISAAAPTRGA